MILVDTSVWIDHLRAGVALLTARLETSMVLSHPLVIGEIALGNLRQRDMILALLQALPPAIPASDPEVLAFIAAQQLAGSGIGYIDAHLLASTRLTVGASLWTRDRRLADIAARLGLAAKLDPPASADRGRC